MFRFEFLGFQLDDHVAVQMCIRDRRKSVPECVYLDQRLADLDSDRSVLEQLQAVNAALAEGELRMRLAHLGLDAHKITAPSGALSGLSLIHI